MAPLIIPFLFFVPALTLGSLCAQDAKWNPTPRTCLIALFIPSPAGPALTLDSFAYSHNLFT